MTKKLMVLMALAAGWCLAQDAAKEPPKFFKLDFVIKDLDGGKVVTARNYSMMVATAGHGHSSQIRAGSKVPVTISKMPNTNQYQMYDVGTNIDCDWVKELPDGMSFQVTVEVTSLLQDQAETAPIVRQNKWASEVVVPLKKPTILFSSDDSSTKHVMQLEVTATPR